MTQYAELWFKFQIWGMYICLGIFGLYTIIFIIKIIMILLSGRKDGKDV